MPKIEFLYFTGCPNVPVARQRLALALSLAKLPEEWVEWNLHDPDSPKRVRQFGSPTILVDGRDIALAQGGTTPDTCRVYRHPDGTLEGAPALRDILAALPPTSAETTDPKSNDR
jgi:mercuric ion transport protein